MKKFILDFLALPLSRAVMTKEFPTTITASRIHKKVSCSYCKYQVEYKLWQVWTVGNHSKIMQGGGAH